MTLGDSILRDAEQYVGQVWGNLNCTGLTFTVSVDVSRPVFYTASSYPSSEIGPYGNTPFTLLNDTSTSNAFTFTTPVSGPSGPFFASDLGSIHAQSDTYDDGWQLVNGTSDSFTTIDDSSAATEPQPGDLFYGVIERNDATMSVHAGIVQSYDPTAHTLTLIDDFDAFRADNGFPAGGALIGPTTFTLGAPQPAGSGIYIIPGDFALYRLADTSAPVEPQSMLPVAIGGTATISHSFLWSFDDISGPGGITYTIVTAPAHGSILLDGLATGTFTQADIDDGLVQFRENGEVASGDFFTFKVSDEAGNTIGPEPFRIAILDHTGPVVTSNDTLSVSSGSNVTSLNPFLLDTVALGNTPDQIAYTLLLPPAHGLILDNGAPATSFTQANIDSHLVHYIASGDGAGSDAFVFQVSDAAGTHTGPQLFAIQIEGSSDLVLSSADILARGNGAPSADQSFTFDDVSTPAGTAEIRAPAASDIIDPAGGSAMNAGTSTSDPMAYWLLTYSTYSSSSGDCQG